jgi:hypothetical protein
MAFLVLGIVFLRILVNATTESLSPSLVLLNENAVWLLAIPLIWAFLAVALGGRSGGPVATKVTGATGGAIAVLCFLFLGSVAYLFTR